MELLFQDGDQHVDGDRGPDLNLDGVLGGSIESPDTQMLFDPAKEQLSGKGLARC